MSGDDSLVPISDEQAKLGQEALKVLAGFGGYLREILGTVPEDLVGLCGGDWLKVRRAENLAATLRKSKERLKARGVTHTEPANLKIALPLFEAAANEGSEQLQDMWARLLASAVDPKRAAQVRLEFIDAVKLMEPLDAGVIEKLGQHANYSPSARDAMMTAFKATSDEVEVAFENLHKLELLSEPMASVTNVRVTPKGRMLLRAVSG